MNPRIGLVVMFLASALIMAPATAAAGVDWWKPYALSAGISLGVGLCIVLIAGGLEDIMGDDEDFLRYGTSPEQLQVPMAGLELVGRRHWNLSVRADGLTVRF